MSTAFQTQLEIAQRWQPVCEAAGMYDAAYTPANTYRLACVIMDDPIVSKRAFAKLRAASQSGVSRHQNFTIEVLNEMTAVEKGALRARIITAHLKH